MTDTSTFPNFQDQAAGAIPVRLVNAGGTGFYTAGSGGTSPSPYVYTPLGYQQITSLVSDASLTVPTGATVAFITPEVQAVRYRDDGTGPTATVGMPLAVGSQLVYSGNLAAIQFIAQTAGAILNISYYR